MGWLGGSTRVTVGTQVSRVIKDTLVPNAARLGTTRAIFNEEDIPENILEATVDSIGISADRMYAYGRDHYLHGLPSGAFRTSAFGAEAVVSILASIEGADVVLDYNHISSPNTQHIGWMRAIADYGYNPATNQLPVLTAAKGSTVYLQDLQVILPSDPIDPDAPVTNYDPVDLEQWGISPQAGFTPWRAANPDAAFSAPILSTAATTQKVRLSYTWLASGFQQQEYVDLDVLVGLDPLEDYMHVKYVTAGGVIKYWLYHLGEGTYPELDAVLSSDATAGTFFPFAYFRYAHVSELADTLSASYLASKKLVKYLGMDYDQIAAAIDDNPDIAHVEQAAMIMAVPADTTNPVERRYLFDFFDALYNASDLPPISSGMVGAKSGLVIQDDRFKMSLGHSGIQKTTVTGVIGVPGFHDSSLGTHDIVVQAIYVDGGVPSDVTIRLPTHIYRKQMNATQYQELEVVNLIALYHVLGKYSVFADDTDDILLVPLDRSITEQYSAKDREELYARSLHFVFNSVIYTHVSWYQSDFFQFLLIVAAIVITISTGLEGMGPVLALLDAGAIDLAILLIEGLVIKYLITYVAFKLFVKLAGPKAALIAAIVLAAIGAYNAIEAGSVQGAPFAQELLQLSSGLAKAVSADLGKQMQGLSKEYEQFNAFRQDEEKKLEEANKLLENNNWLNPFVIFGERPEDFFNRTVHSANVGIMGIEAISNYVDIALTLPKLDQTIGETTYGI